MFIYLNLYGNMIDFFGVVVFVRILRINVILSYLNLWFNFIGDLGVVEFVEIL